MLHNICKIGGNSVAGLHTSDSQLTDILIRGDEILPSKWKVYQRRGGHNRANSSELGLDLIEQKRRVAKYLPYILKKGSAIYKGRRDIL
jgi:hypothetical protein